MESYQLHDLVALLISNEKHNLQKGQVGTIVEILEENKFFLVEFADKHGETLALVPLNHEQILLLHLHSELAA
jgi:ribosomal 30S subunit maturation factor RimM